MSYAVINVLQSTEETEESFDDENENSYDISRDQITASFLMSISDRMIGQFLQSPIHDEVDTEESIETDSFV